MSNFKIVEDNSARVNAVDFLKRITAWAVLVGLLSFVTGAIICLYGLFIPVYPEMLLVDPDAMFTIVMGVVYLITTMAALLMAFSGRNSLMEIIDNFKAGMVLRVILTIFGVALVIGPCMWGCDLMMADLNYWGAFDLEALHSVEPNVLLDYIIVWIIAFAMKFSN